MCQVSNSFKKNQHLRKPLKLKYLRGIERKYRPQIKERLNIQVNKVLTKSFIQSAVDKWQEINRASQQVDEFDRYLEAELRRSEPLQEDSTDNKKMEALLLALYFLTFKTSLETDKRDTYSSFLRTGNARLIAIAEKIDFNVKITNPSVIRRLEDQATALTKELNSTTFTRIKNFVKSEVTSNKSTERIIKDITAIEGVNLRRSYTIARDQIMGAKNYETKLYLQKRGFRAWTWQCNQPEDMACIMNCGTTRRIGDTFPSGHTQPQIHRNCECYTIAIELDPSSPDFFMIVGFIEIGIDWMGD